MKSVVYSHTGDPSVLRLVDRDVSEPGPGEVRVSVVVSGGGSPEACPGGQPSSPTVPATLRKRSRLVIIV